MILIVYYISLLLQLCVVCSEFLSLAIYYQRMSDTRHIAKNREVCEPSQRASLDLRFLAHLVDVYIMYTGL